jgi:hypothetical protein
MSKSIELYWSSNMQPLNVSFSVCTSCKECIKILIVRTYDLEFIIRKQVYDIFFNVLQYTFQ